MENNLSNPELCKHAVKVIPKLGATAIVLAYDKKRAVKSLQKKCASLSGRRKHAICKMHYSGWTNRRIFL